jgi:RteC protein
MEGIAGYLSLGSYLNLTAMIKPFDTLYAELEKVLKQGDKTLRGPEKYLQGINFIREQIGKMRVQGVKIMRNEAAEIAFFREVWPAFHAKLLLYIWLYQLELRRSLTSADDWPAIMLQEENRVALFFRRNGRFWQYYRAGARGLDKQFTRAYSQSRIFEPLIIVMDQDGATLASYRAAWCLAMKNYGEWLQEERALISAGATSAADLGYSWGASDADLAELLFGIQAVGAVQYHGQAADISRLQKWARLALGKEIANIYNRGKVLRTRKKERLAFTKKMEGALAKKWDQAEGKFD